MAIPSTTLTDVEVAQTLFQMEETIRYRLRLKEIIPIEMSRYRIGNLGAFRILRLAHFSRSRRLCPF